MAHLTYDDLCLLHGSLYAQIQKHMLDVYAITGCDPVVGTDQNGLKSIAYLRPQTEAQTVEMMMGREMSNAAIDISRHPVIELRMSGEYLVLEWVLPPTAWWDQQNLVGKLAVDRHRHSFRRMISHLEADFRLGFWHGAHLDHHSLMPNQVVHPAVFEPWISTFCHGQDWFRVGIWYDTVPQDITFLTSEVFKHFQTLYRLYGFVSWTGSNDYRLFYQKSSFDAYYA